MIICGTFVHCKDLDGLCVEKAICIIDGSGTIIEYELEGSQRFTEILASNEPIILNGFWIPGFVDTHSHAPQFVNLGTGLDEPLLDWLRNTTFPTEKSFSGSTEEIASTYKNMISEYLKAGSTTVCYFGSVDVDANLVLVQKIKERGQRAFVGKVCMDYNDLFDYAEPSCMHSLEATNKFLESFEKSSLVKPIITPRFALSCSMDLMKGLSEIARIRDLPIQSHLSENTAELEAVERAFPECSDYTRVYEKAGLLGPKTIMAHCIHLSDSELKLIQKTNTAISHCPNSNFSLNSGIMNIRKALNANIRVGLGTDISGGYSLSLFDSMRQAIIASKAIYFAHPEYKPLTCAEAFYLATLGGARSLNLESIIGNFEKGKSFDAILIKGQFDGIEKLVYTCDRYCIDRVYIAGKEVTATIE